MSERLSALRFVKDVTLRPVEIGGGGGGGRRAVFGVMRVELTGWAAPEIIYRGIGNEPN